MIRLVRTADQTVNNSPIQLLHSHTAPVPVGRSQTLTVDHIRFMVQLPQQHQRPPHSQDQKHTPHSSTCQVAMDSIMISPAHHAPNQLLRDPKLKLNHKLTHPIDSTTHQSQLQRDSNIISHHTQRSQLVTQMFGNSRLLEEPKLIR